MQNIVTMTGCEFQLLIQDEASMNMTIGAGGSIKQSIKKDKYDPRIWDTSNAKLINIQLVNSTAFELITGQLAPRTPVTYKTYAKAGLPFYEIYKEKPSSISGAFSQVKTISEVDAARQEEEDAGHEFGPLKPASCSRCRNNLADIV